MRPVICDWCGADCTHDFCTVYMRIESRDERGHTIADDDTEPADLCPPCGQAARKVLRLKLRDKAGTDAYESDLARSLPPELASTVRRAGPHEPG